MVRLRCIRYIPDPHPNISLTINTSSKKLYGPIQRLQEKPPTRSQGFFKGQSQGQGFLRDRYCQSFASNLSLFPQFLLLLIAGFVSPLLQWRRRRSPRRPRTRRSTFSRTTTSLKSLRSTKVKLFFFFFLHRNCQIIDLVFFFFWLNLSIFDQGLFDSNLGLA